MSSDSFDPIAKIFWSKYSAYVAARKVLEDFPDMPSSANASDTSLMNRREMSVFVKCYRNHVDVR